MAPLGLLRLPFTPGSGWQALQRQRPSIAALAWGLVLPMSLLPPLLFFYAGTHYGDAFVAGFAERQWRFITTILFLAELLTFFVMGWLIHAVVNANDELTLSYHDAYLLAAFAPLPLWLASLALLVPNLMFNLLVALAALGLSCRLLYHGLQALCQRGANDVALMSATYTIIAAGVLAWGLLMAIVWAY
ncbi:YIP1 family protein [Halomonas dongshanensis]|uniref:YIP1 family protein n=1 Tax=Halomonas dongshanensis TaxID=2890835 RepID=A0ABT2EFV5_9GAMM|nr:YIP1 family protein [Halomonas dongshanensis]MCS2610467.1 YIP1 family protein [Halomonas dongshanensis]